MEPLRVTRLSSFNAQNLLLEFASVRHARLDGIYVSLTANDPSAWVGVIFVRKGPYAPAILRFHISFPSGYPSVAPLVTFSTDVFHPLLTPLTTYTYSTGGTDAETVSASDDERLPPGVFSLRHGFPHLFGRAKRHASHSGESLRVPRREGAELPVNVSLEENENVRQTRPSRPICVAEILRYIQSTFTDEAVLDSITLEAAANPGAYHAWRTYRAVALEKAANGAGIVNASDGAGQPSRARPRRPGEWNWEGVWQERVKKGIRNSISEAALFAGGPDEIQFLDMDADGLNRAKNEIEASAAALAIQ